MYFLIIIVIMKLIKIIIHCESKCVKNNFNISILVIQFFPYKNITHLNVQNPCLYAIQYVVTFTQKTNHTHILKSFFTHLQNWMYTYFKRLTRTIFSGIFLFKIQIRFLNIHSFKCMKNMKKINHMANLNADSCDCKRCCSKEDE